MRQTTGPSRPSASTSSATDRRRRRRHGRRDRRRLRRLVEQPIAESGNLRVVLPRERANEVVGEVGADGKRRVEGLDEAAGGEVVIDEKLVAEGHALTLDRRLDRQFRQHETGTAPGIDIGHTRGSQPHVPGRIDAVEFADVGMDQMMMAKIFRTPQWRRSVEQRRATHRGDHVLGEKRGMQARIAAAAIANRRVDIVAVEIDDDETLDWAARNGISPMVGADVPTEAAADRLARYRAVADSAGRARREVEAVLERRIALDGDADDRTLGGSPRDILNAIRALRGRTGISHFVWRRSSAAPMDLYRFASEIEMLLQA